MNMHILNGRCEGDEDGEITFVAAQGKSVIDYVIVETELYSYCEHFQIIDYDSCSHFPISVYMSFIEQMYSSNRDSQKYTKQIKFRWVAEKADEFLHKLNDEHSQYQLSLLGNEVVRDVNNAVAILVNVIHRAAESMTISTTFKRNTSHRLPRWWNENCSKQKVIKNKLLNRFRMTNATSDLNNYLTAKKCFRNVCKEAQKTDQKYLTIQLCDRVNDTTCFWKHIKSMNSKGNVIDKSEITGSEWNNYFKELLNNDVNIDEDFKTMTDDFVRQHNELCNACDNNTVDFLNDEISRIEIFKAIYSLIFGKAAGNDGIVGEMLKISKYVLIPHLFILFNNILESGIYPNGWCEAILCPLLHIRMVL